MGRSRPWIIRNTFEIEVPVMVKYGPAEAGVKAKGGVEDKTDREHRLSVHGYTLSDDDHKYDNCVNWRVLENRALKTGIFYRFLAATVVLIPTDGTSTMKMKMNVKPSVAFSLNPARLFSKRDDPVFLDGKTAKGLPVSAGLDFNDKKFPWTDVVKFPVEYEVSLSYPNADAVETHRGEEGTQLDRGAREVE